MIKGKQWKLIRKSLNKAGQVASLILLSIAILLFLGSAGIFFAQKKILQTKAMIAADAGGMYLNSQIGSYAHYLACKYIKCRCHRSKKRWGMIVAISLAVASVAFAGFNLGNLAILSGTTAVSLGVSDEIQVEQGVKALNKQFKQLSSSDVKSYYKWSTIQYIAQLLADPGIIAGLSEDIKNKSASDESDSSGGFYSLTEAIANELLDAYDDILGSHIFLFSPLLYSSTWDFPTLLDAIDEWDSLVGGRVVDPTFYRESDPTLGYDYTLSSTDYVRYVFFQNLYPGRDGDDLSLNGLMVALRGGHIDGIEALSSIKSLESCDSNEEDCSGEETFSVELNKAKGALQRMKDNINMYDLDAYTPLRITSYCWADDFDCIQYDGNPYNTLQYISRAVSSVSHGNLMDHPKMSRDDYQQLKNDLISQIDSAIQAIDLFLNRVDSIFDKYKESLNHYLLNPVNGSYEYAWTDSLGRHHHIVVSVTFKLPRIKVKKKLFKVKIKLKQCQQTMHVMACRNNFCYRSTVHYNAHSGDGPTTSHWWIEGS